MHETNKAMKVSDMSEASMRLTTAGRRATSGELPQPRFSSAAKGWRGVLVEYFSGVTADFTAVFANHGVAVHQNGCMDVYQRVEGQSSRTRMRPGNITITPAGVEKVFHHRGGGDFLVVHLAPDLLSRIAGEVTATDPANAELTNVFCTRNANIETLVRKLWSEYRTGDLASGLYAETLGIELAIQLLRSHSTLSRVANSPEYKLPPKLLAKAFEYIDANLANDLTLEEVARALSLSASHFAHAFKNATGIAPHRYVTVQRVGLAKALLRETDLPIASVAIRTGFSTHAHFCVAFQRLTGHTPRQFRQAQ
jgi:AraC family transcriptional regulator